VDVGGHNPLEPAALAVPVVTGPVMYNFQQITDSLSATGALVRVGDTEALTRVVRGWLADPAAARRAGEAGARFVEANRGALARHMTLVSRLLSGGTT
jgi:3-deoxy-D-manno-octulosonic-acid transferase